MIYLIVFTSIGMIGGFLVHQFGDSYRNEGWGILGYCLMLCGTAITILLTISIPIQRESILVQIARHEALRKTIELARQRDDDVERYTFLERIASSNTALAAYKAENKMQWDLWTPDEIENIKPIE